MARPKVPLLSRRNVVAATVLVLEREGREALSMRRIAEELNVNAASLYHHFASKDEILSAAARALLAEINVQEFDATKQDFVSWHGDIAVEHRRFLISRPYMIPLLTQRVVPRMTLPVALISDAELSRYQISNPDDRMYILDSIEGFVVGSAIMAISTADGRAQIPRRRHGGEHSPEEQLFAKLVRQLIEGLVAHFAGWEDDTRDAS